MNLSEGVPSHPSETIVTAPLWLVGWMIDQLGSSIVLSDNELGYIMDRAIDEEWNIEIYRNDNFQTHIILEKKGDT